MSTLKATNLQHKDSSDPNVVLYADGSTSIRNLQNFDSNVIINGAMVIDQRSNGAEADTAGKEYITCDRWRSNYSVASKFKLQQVNDAPKGFSNSLKATSSSAYSPSATDYFVLQQFIEGQTIAKFAFATPVAKTITLSFWVKASQTGDYAVAISNGSFNRSYVTTVKVNTASTWEQKVVVVPGDTGGSWVNSTETGMAVKFDFGSGSNYNTTTKDTWQDSDKLNAAGAVSLVGVNGATFQVTGVQLNAANGLTEYQHESYDETLAKCRPYYQKYTFQNVQFQRICMVSSTGGTGGVAMFNLAQPLRRNIQLAGFTSSAASSFRINGLSDPADRVISSMALSNNHGRGDYVIGIDINFQNSRPVGSANYLSRENTASPCFFAFEAEL